ncbi:hypothetical protein [Haloarchaeobius sp. DFWS5]|uniref:hypothetical protein n=1 Tax=Haloarchaeobius sp. DFWS5 TaxID=3446114 RepID=UPI003EBF7917
MVSNSKREYLKYAGIGLATLVFGVGGKLAIEQTTTPGSASVDTPPVETELDGGLVSDGHTPDSPAPDGVTPDDPAPAVDAGGDEAENLGHNVYGTPLEFERDADDGNIDFMWGLIEFETDEGDKDIEFYAEEPGIYIDFETSQDGHDLDLVMVVDGDAIELEVDGYDNVEFDAVGSGHSFERDADDEIDFDSALIQLEWDPYRHQLKIRGVVNLDWDGDEFEYRGLDVRLDWEASEGTPGHHDWKVGEFEARLR